MRVLIKIMYDGSNYCGWQLQPNVPTIQGEIESAIFKVTGENVNVTASGRTDSGVHALAQVAHFDIKSAFDIKKLINALNFYLNPAIRVFFAKKVSESFSARFNAKKKTYIYKMYVSQFDNPLLFKRELRLDSCNTNLMKTAASLFVGEHDFSAFMSSGSEVKNTIRTIYSCKLMAKGNSLTLSVCANGFLYNMVRKIAASIIDVGYLKLTLDELNQHILFPKGAIKQIAPPFALYLKSVKY